MKISLPGLVIAGGLVALAAAGLASAPRAFSTTPLTLPFNISGTWKGSAKTQGASGAVTFRLEQIGTNISGTVDIQNNFIKSCGLVSGTVQGPFANSVFDATMDTPHLNVFTCAITGSDVNLVGMLLANNIKMSGTFQMFVQELDNGNGATVTINLSLVKKSGMVTKTDPDGSGPAVEAGSPLPGAHDLAVTKVIAPKTVSLTATKPSKAGLIKVEIQNRSQHDEVILDEAMLDDAVTLTCTPLGTLQSGTPPVPVLHVGKPQKPLPVTLKPKQKLLVVYDVTIDGAFDPNKTVGASFHGDYTWTAEVDHEALDGLADDHPADDVCPRGAAAPYDFDHYPDGTVKDKGAGAVQSDKTLGAAIVTDVVVK